MWLGKVSLRRWHLVKDLGEEKKKVDIWGKHSRLRKLQLQKPEGRESWMFEDSVAGIKWESRSILGAEFMERRGCQSAQADKPVEGQASIGVSQGALANYWAEEWSMKLVLRWLFQNLYWEQVLKEWVSVESGKPIRILLQSLGGGVLVAWSREVAERREVVSLSTHPEKDNW